VAATLIPKCSPLSCTSAIWPSLRDTTAIRLRLRHAATLVSAYATCSTAPTGAAYHRGFHKDGTTIFIPRRTGPPSPSAASTRYAKTRCDHFRRRFLSDGERDQMVLRLRVRGLTVCVY